MWLQAASLRDPDETQGWNHRPGSPGPQQSCPGGGCVHGGHPAHSPPTHRPGFSVIPYEELPHPKFQALKQQETNRMYFIKKGCDQL